MAMVFVTSVGCKGLALDAKPQFWISGQKFEFVIQDLFVLLFCQA